MIILIINRSTEDSLQPLQDKLLDLEDQIKDQKSKINAVKAQIMRNTDNIQNLLKSVVSAKW